MQNQTTVKRESDLLIKGMISSGIRTEVVECNSGSHLRGAYET